MSGFRPALRIALHDALRAKGRTALILCMVGLPVAAVVGFGVVWKTLEWTPRESLPHEIGAADARLTGVAREPIGQFPDNGETSIGATAEAAPWTTAEITRRVVAEYGADVRVLPMNFGDLEIVTSAGRLRVPLHELDVRDPMARGILEITDGRAPGAPGEIALSPSLAARGLGLGGSVRVGADETPMRVVGYVRGPYVSPDHEATEHLAVALPGAVPADPSADPTEAGPLRHWLVDAGGPVTWEDVTAFNEDGIMVLSRDVVEHPPGAAGAGRAEAIDLSSPPEWPATRTGTVVALAGAMIALEIVLLAGPALAVDVRRRRRLLALVAVAGGGPRHLRAVVLAGGLLLGGAGALAGLPIGIAAGAATTAVMRATADTPLGPFEVPWAVAAATVLLGAVSGLAAAYVPARRAARTDVAAVLAGRRDPVPVRRPRRLPVAGAALVAAGVLCCLFGVRAFRGFGAAGGAAGIVIGAVMITPWLVGATGRVAGRLPVPLRLAVRDGARNRARTAPAVAAIMAAVAGAGAIATVDAGDSERASAGYRPRLPMGATMIQVPPTPAGEDRAARVRAAIERELPGLPLLDLWALPGGTCHREIDPECRTVSFEHAGPGRPTPPGTVPGDGPAWARKLFGRNEPVEGVNVYPDIVVGGAAEARMLLGRDAPEAVAALRAGKIVLFGGGPAVHGGTVTATVRELDRDVPAPVPVRRVRGLPAVRVPAAVHPTAVMPPSAAERIGLRPRVAAFGVDGAEHRLGEAEAARLGDVLAGTEGGHRGDVYTERGARRTGDSRAPLLAALAAVLALGGALTATRLSAADARPDLAVLAAIGARARTRRVLAAGQAAYIAALGCWLGIAAGIVPGLAASHLLARGPGDHGDPGPFLDVPWTTLLLIGIGVPLITAVVAGLCTRPKLPMTHATAT